MTNLVDATYLQPHNKDLWKIFSMDSYFTADNIRDFRMLDFGCNRGNFLATAYGHTREPLRFNPIHYRGLDLNLNAVNQAKATYPLTAHNIIHYNKYHRSFNPGGVPGQLASSYFDIKFDLIIAYSVLTHMTVNEARETIADLKTLLKPNGCILFTVWTAESLEGFYNYTSASRNLEKTPQRYSELVSKPFSNVLYWLDHERSVADVNDLDPNSMSGFSSFYKNVNSVMTYFPDAEYLGKPNFPRQFQQMFKISAA
jgi:SAM-dependent methyltransferase